MKLRMHTVPYKGVWLGILILVSASFSEAQEDQSIGMQRYLESFQAQVNRRADWLQTQGRHPNYLRIRALFTPQLIRKLISAPGGELSKEVQLIVDSRAQTLAARYTPEEIARLQRKGIDPIRARFGQSDTTTESLFYEASDDVIVGVVLKATTPETYGDGFFSTVTIRVQEVLKGPLRVGDTILLRQKTGKNSDSTWGALPDEVIQGEYGRITVPDSSVQFVLHLSQKTYGLRVVSNNKTPAIGKNFYIQTAAPFRIEGNRLQFLGQHLVAPFRLPETVAEIREVAARFRD